MCIREGEAGFGQDFLLKVIRLGCAISSISSGLVQVPPETDFGDELWRAGY